MSSGEENRTGGTWLPRGPETGVARPERPALSDRTPAPVTGKAAVPLALRRSQAMWYVAVAMLFFSVVMIIMTRASITTSLTELLREQDATVSETRLADVAPMIVYAAIAALLVVAIPEWAFATALTRRRPWPRIVYGSRGHPPRRRSGPLHSAHPAVGLAGLAAGRGAGLRWAARPGRVRTRVRAVGLRLAAYATRGPGVASD